MEAVGGEASEDEVSVTDDDGEDAFEIRNGPSWGDHDDEEEEEEEEEEEHAGRPDAMSMVLALACTVAAAAAVWVIRRARRRKKGRSRRSSTAPEDVASDVDVDVDVDGSPLPLPASGSSSSAGVEAAEPVPRNRCAQCGATEPKTSGDKLMRCSRCKGVFFCSHECQKLHWPTHKGVCRAVHGAHSPGGGLAADAAAAATRAEARAVMARKMVEKRENTMKLRSLQDKVTEASALFWRGQYRSAIAQLQDVAATAHDIPGGQTIECEALRMVGHGLIRLRMFAPAAECLDTCLGLATALENPSLQANAYIALGQLAGSKEEPDHATSQKYFDRARHISKAFADTAGQAAASLNLANAMARAGDVEGGLEMMKEALELRRIQSRAAAARVDADDTGEGSNREELLQALNEARRAEAAALANVGSATAAMDGLEGDACSYFDEALQFLRREDGEAVVDRELEIAILLNLANIKENHVKGGHAKAVGHRKELDALMRSALGGGRCVPESCAICLDPLRALEVREEEGDEGDGEEGTGSKRVSCLECLHCYHTECWRTWAEKSGSCPECKRRVSMVGA